MKKGERFKETVKCTYMFMMEAKELAFTITEGSFAEKIDEKGEHFRFEYDPATGDLVAETTAMAHLFPKFDHDST